MLPPLIRMGAASCPISTQALVATPLIGAGAATSTLLKV